LIVEDYYQLLGVQSDDARETIRDAYRAKKAELDAAGTDAARSHASKLNRAWNVLSDEIQRGRYDDQLAEAKADGTVEDSADFEPEPEVASGRGRNSRARGERPVRQPIAQDMEINGVSLASNKDRGFALAIDAFLVFALTMVAPILLAPKVVSDDMRTSYCIEKYSDKNALECQAEISDDASDKKGDLDDAKDAVADGEKDKIDAAELDVLEDKRDGLQVEYDALVDEYEAVGDKIQPLMLTLFGGGYLIAFLVLAVPTLLTGKTPGKALRRIHLVGDTGGRAGPRATLVRYGVVLGTMTVSAMFLGQLAQFVPLVWMFGVTSFARNPHRQGWHDRIAKTYVAVD
jgi:RDD family/DnaJ domain